MIDPMILAIKDDDIYKQIEAYPAPEHRSFGLANQAALLYVILHFDIDILQNKKAKMREIVDKHFYDNWVIPFYLGHYVDLTKEWENYKAARIALGHTLDLDSIQELVNRNNGRLDSCYEDCDQHLIEGVLDEEYVLEKYESLLTILRESNITVRWLMLHRNTTHPEVKKIVTKDFNQKKVLALLLVCSKFE